MKNERRGRGKLQNPHTTAQSGTDRSTHGAQKKQANLKQSTSISVKRKRAIRRPPLGRARFLKLLGLTPEVGLTPLGFVGPTTLSFQSLKALGLTPLGLFDPTALGGYGLKALGQKPFGLKPLVSLALLLGLRKLGSDGCLPLSAHGGLELKSAYGGDQSRGGRLPFQSPC